MTHHKNANRVAAGYQIDHPSLVETGQQYENTQCIPSHFGLT